MSDPLSIAWGSLVAFFAAYWMLLAIATAIVWSFYSKGRRPTVTELVEVLSLCAGIVAGLTGFRSANALQASENVIFCVRFGGVILAVASGYGLYDLLVKPDIFTPTPVQPPRTRGTPKRGHRRSAAG